MSLGKAYVMGQHEAEAQAYVDVIVFDIIKVSVEEQHRTKVQTELSETGVKAAPSQAIE